MALGSRAAPGPCTAPCQGRYRVAVSSNWTPRRDRQSCGLETALAPSPRIFFFVSKSTHLEQMFLQRLMIGRGQCVLHACNPPLIIHLHQKMMFSSFAGEDSRLYFVQCFFLVYFVPFP